MVDDDAEAVDTDDVYVEATFTYSDSPTVTIRETILGLSPSVLIQPDVDEEAGRYGFVVWSVDLDPPDLVTILRLCADNIEIAAERERTT